LREINAILMAVLSGALLSAGFPPYEFSFLPWISLVPLLIVTTDKCAHYGFLLSFLSGMTFFPILFNWILEVPNYTFFHHAVLGLYLSSYFGLFGLSFSFISRQLGTAPALFAAPFLWIALEYLRSNLFFLALPWGLLAHTQYTVPLVIQIVSITGAYGVSFLIVMVNSAIAMLILAVMNRQQKKEPILDKPISKKGAYTVVLTATLLLSMTLFYGHLSLSKPIFGNEVKLSVVQGNIEQSKKWDQNYAKYIMQTYTELTREASRDRPALIVWPELATPGAINRDLNLAGQIRNISNKAETYLLLGSSEAQKYGGEKNNPIKYSNSAFLIHPQNKIDDTRKYDKIRLLPFGEYIPLKEIIPWSYINVPKIGEGRPGNEFTIFEVQSFTFAVTICWENIFPGLFRQFVKRGAQFMINITNEAWFGKSAAPYQFLSMSVFRAVENGVFVIRCANTGVSCFIDPHGRIVDRLKDANGQDTFIRGVLSRSIVPGDSKNVYTRYGDWSGWLSILCTISFLLMAFRKKNLKPPLSNLYKREIGC
jgi:apolipoprotein N-acyltransferase